MDLVVVMPVPLLADICRRGVKPLRAIMQRRVKAGGDKVTSHIGFERYTRLEIDIEEPRPCNQRQGIKEKLKIMELSGIIDADKKEAAQDIRCACGKICNSRITPVEKFDPKTHKTDKVGS